MKKKSVVPTNLPQLKCENCGKQAYAHETWANDSIGNILLIDVDPWPTYYRDFGNIRKEFCSCHCCTEWLQKN